MVLCTGWYAAARGYWARDVLSWHLLRPHLCTNIFSLIQVHVYYARFSGGFSGDQFYFYHGDGRFLGERGKVFNDFFQISRRGVGRVGLAKTAKPFCSKFEKNR